MSRYCPEKDGQALYTECIECRKEEGKSFCQNFFLLVAGSRSFTDYNLLKEKLDTLLRHKMPNVVIISGGAKGADTLAEKYAKERNLETRIFPADWEKHGKSAGYIRNKTMHNYICNAAPEKTQRGCVCFWDGKSSGTAQNFELARSCNTPLKTIRYSNHENSGHAL